MISLVPDFDDVMLDFKARHGKYPKLISTSARPAEKTTRFEELRAEIRSTDQPHLILFGTGWGMAEELLARCDFRLEPICGPTEYNHLSVRAAAAITFDRLLRVVG